VVKEHTQIVVVLMGILDLAVTAAAWPVCYYLRFKTGWFSLSGPYPELGELKYVIAVCLLLTMLIFGRLGMYAPRRRRTVGSEFLDIIRSCVLVWAVLLAIIYFLRGRQIISRKLLGMYLVAWPTMLIAHRGLARCVLRFLRRHGRNLRSAAIIGSGRLGQKLLHTLRRQPWTGYDVRYFVEDRRVGGELLGIPVHGPVGEVDRIIGRWPVDAVFVALPKARTEQLTHVLNSLSAELVDINVVPDLLSYHFLSHRVQQLGALPLVNLTYSPQSGWNAAAKRIFDVVVSIIALIVLSPLLLFIAAAIKLTSRGAPFYRQQRASVGGKEFRIIKFRSMVPNAEAEDGAVWASKNDPRATPVGRILRKLSLDELPQLINVLVGDMSLVGPRPERPELIKRFSKQIPGYMLRHHVKAGLTGWAQVNGFRGRTSLHKRIQYDLDYITRWSFGLDLWILVLTIFRGFINTQG